MKINKKIKVLTGVLLTLFTLFILVYGLRRIGLISYKKDGVYDYLKCSGVPGRMKWKEDLREYEGQCKKKKNFTFEKELIKQGEQYFYKNIGQGISFSFKDKGKHYELKPDYNNITLFSYHNKERKSLYESVEISFSFLGGMEFVDLESPSYGLKERIIKTSRVNAIPGEDGSEEWRRGIYEASTGLKYRYQTRPYMTLSQQQERQIEEAKKRGDKVGSMLVWPKIKKEKRIYYTLHCGQCYDMVTISGDIESNLLKEIIDSLGFDSN